MTAIGDFLEISTRLLQNIQIVKGYVELVFHKMVLALYHYPHSYPQYQH